MEFKLLTRDQYNFIYELYKKAQETIDEIREKFPDVEKYESSDAFINSKTGLFKSKETIKKTTEMFDEILKELGGFDNSTSLQFVFARIFLSNLSIMINIKDSNQWNDFKSKVEPYIYSRTNEIEKNDPQYKIFNALWKQIHIDADMRSFGKSLKELVEKHICEDDPMREEIIISLKST